LFIAEELGDDESFVLFVAAILTVVVVYRWMARVSRTTTLGRWDFWRLPLVLWPAGCLLGILMPVLCAWSDPQVRGDGRYIALFMLVGVLVVTVGTSALSWLGIWASEDAIEASNPAAVNIVCAAQLSVTFIYAGANIGSGDTIWTTIGPAFLGLATWFCIWAIVEVSTGISEAIAIERDVATSLRFGGFIVACGAILGRALAGNFVSTDATFRDLFLEGWPVLPLAVIAIAMQIRLRPTPTMPRPAAGVKGVVLGLVFLVAGAAWVLRQGWWR